MKRRMSKKTFMGLLYCLTDDPRQHQSWSFRSLFRRSQVDVSEMYVSRLRQIRRDSRRPAVIPRGYIYLGQRHKGSKY